MTARLTIVLGPDVLRALRGSGSIRIEAGGNGSAPRTPAPSRAPKTARAGAGGFREGSLPAKLMAWVKGRKTFGVPQLMKKLRIKRGHASMLVSYVLKAGAVRRVGRGAYKAA